MTRSRLALAATALLLLAGCAARTPRIARVPRAKQVTRRPTPPPQLPPPLPRIEYSVQVGAFADADNAVSLIETLGDRGLEAFYFASDDGLHRVRFGSFTSRELAVERAEALRAEQVIDEYYVVSPGLAGAGGNDAALRRELVRSAMSFLGWPYRWGGPSPETGFDCSGLTMTAYRLNGLALPRTASAQYEAGEPVSRDALQEADLVFFATERDDAPSHVGLYVGDGRFVHAPGRGAVVRVDALADNYYEQRFLAARSYLGGNTTAATP